MRQDTRIYAGLFDVDERATVALPPNRFAYIHVARGSVTVNGVTLNEGDGARVRGEDTLTFSDGKQAEVLLFDLRPIEVTAEWA